MRLQRAAGCAIAGLIGSIIGSLIAISSVRAGRHAVLAQAARGKPDQAGSGQIAAGGQQNRAALACQHEQQVDR